MQIAPSDRGHRRAGVRLVVSLMFGLWLQMLALSVWPDFHEWLHTDSESSAHECPVTLLNKGIVFVESPSSVAIVPLAVSADSLFAYNEYCWQDQDYRLAPSRAPPVL